MFQILMYHAQYTHSHMSERRWTNVHILTHARTHAHISKINEWMNEYMHNIFVLGPELNNWILARKERRDRENEIELVLSYRYRSIHFRQLHTVSFHPHHTYRCSKWRTFSVLTIMWTHLVHSYTQLQKHPRKTTSTNCSLYSFGKLKLKFQANKFKWKDTHKQVGTMKFAWKTHSERMVRSRNSLLFRCMHAYDELSLP